MCILVLINRWEYCGECHRALIPEYGVSRRIPAELSFNQGSHPGRALILAGLSGPVGKPKSIHSAKRIVQKMAKTTV